MAEEEPSPVQQVVEVAIKPLVGFIVYILPLLIVATKNAYNYFMKLPQNMMRFIIGFVFCFFGGTFPTLFAAIEAAEYGGRKTFVSAVSDLAEEAMIVIEASKKDDDADDDKDGSKDVDQISGTEFLARKMRLVLKKMNPEKLDKAISSIYSVWLSVAAVLSIQFARTISMSLAIAEFLEKPADRFLLPLLNTVIPDEYEKWIPVVLRWVTKGMAMSIAWYIQAVVSAATSALTGGLMMARAAFHFCVHRDLKVFGWIPDDHTESNMDEILSYVFAGMGFYFQFRLGFTLPFPLNWLLSPFQFAEYYIRWSITK